MSTSAIFDIRPSVASDRICRFHIAGELDSAAAPHLISTLRKALGGVTSGRIHIDLSGVTFIDCSGLTALLIGVRNARRHGCELEVDEPVSLPVRRMIDMTGVDRLLWP